jgi:hypothetical protein
MKWEPDRNEDGTLNPCCFNSADGQWSILRAPQEGYPATYTLIHRAGKPVAVAYRTAASEAARAGTMRELTEMVHA